jgi:hypothetical protein
VARNTVMLTAPIAINKRDNGFCAVRYLGMQEDELNKFVIKLISDQIQLIFWNP